MVGDAREEWPKTMMALVAGIGQQSREVAGWARRLGWQSWAPTASSFEALWPGRKARDQFAEGQNQQIGLAATHCGTFAIASNSGRRRNWQLIFQLPAIRLQRMA